MAATEEPRIRAAALAWLNDATLGGTVPISRDRLADEFRVDGERFPLVDRGRGIRKPRGWQAALSILTAQGRPYDDKEGLDGLHRYKIRRDQGGSAENEGLRAAMESGAPLIWFYAVRPGLFNAIFPVWLTAEERDQDQFVMALTEEQRSIAPQGTVEAALRHYLISETRRRLHQPLFASQVLLAYETRCAICRIGHRELLDAAHIIPDSAPGGDPVISNGLALCKIHHAAYDRNILGIRPDLVVEIHHRLLDEIDGPMLRHGLQEHHRTALLQIPRRRADRPDPDRLLERYAEFRAA